MTWSTTTRVSLPVALSCALVLSGTACGDDGPDRCGDGVLDQGEQCDDGNRMSGDGCNALCLNGR